MGLDDYVRDGDALARSQLQALRSYGYDAVFGVMDVNVETEAAGSVLRYRAGQYPVVERYGFSPETPLSAGRIPDPERAGRMPEVLKALRRMRAELQDTVPVVGCVLGPLTIATQLVGIETALDLALDDMDRLEEFLDFSTEVAIAYGIGQLRAGAHLVLVFDPSASPAVVPARFFQRFEAPRLRRVFEALCVAGNAACWLHIAGPAGSVLPFYSEVGVHIANFDYEVSPGEATAALPNVCLDGNIRPLLFVDGSPMEVRTEARGLVNAFSSRGGFILSSGCEIPPEASPENVAAMVDAARPGF